MEDKNETINPADLPENEVFKKTTVNQFPQPADWGKPLRGEDKADPSLTGKHAERTSEAEGLNEAGSDAEAGAYEGFEDQGGE